LTAAFAHARRAAELRRGPDLNELRAALHLLRGEFAAAWYYVQTCTGTGP
jgi:hypothetical protein